MKSPISGSKLAVGSSKSNISGLLIKDFANETLFFDQKKVPQFSFEKFFMSNSLEISFILHPNFVFHITTVDL